MKSFISIVLCLLLNLSVFAQVRITHIVQKGEGIDYISKKYQVPISEIQSENPSIDVNQIYVGLELNISIKDVQSLVFSHNNSYVRKAANLVSLGNYGKAIKLYSKAIKESPHPDYYFFRGLCYLKNGKYKYAIKDLESADGCKTLSAVYKQDCSNLLNRAKSLREEQLDKRWNVWETVVGSLALAGTAFAQANTYNKLAQVPNANIATGTAFIQQNGVPNPYPTFPSSGIVPNPEWEQYAYGFNPQINPELLKMANNTILDVKQQSYNQYLSFCQSMEKSGGKVISYDEWLAMRGQAIMNIEVNKVDSEPSLQKDNEQKDYYNHKCFKCKETGTYTCPCKDVETFNYYRLHKCTNCGKEHETATLHTCQCNICHGTGVK